MTHIRLTSWNIKELDEVLNGTRPAEVARRAAIAEQILALDADILCVLEASRDLAAFRRFVTQELADQYEIAILPGTDEVLALADEAEKWRELTRLYGLPNRKKSAGGPAAQWIWFLVRRSLNAAPRLLSPRVFDEFARAQFEDAEDRDRDDGRWIVYWWQGETPVKHRHDRHPQVLQLTLAGKPVEIIGCHLKSKINQAKVERNPDGSLTGPYLRTATQARGKLASEAVHVRKYIDARFAQEPDPLIFVVGDLNDGPGKEFFERKYMLFDLISNLQGSIFEARKYLNHALFDYEGELRWSYFLHGKDKVDPDRDPKVLLDHILFTQGLVDKTSLPRVEPGAGKVEHLIHDTINAMRPKDPTSDHKPVSCMIRVA